MKTARTLVEAPRYGFSDTVLAINRTGARDLLTVPITWRYCAESRISIGSPIYLDVGQDISALGLTVDQGDVATGFALLETDGIEYVNPDLFDTPPFIHIPLDYPASTITMPMNDVTYPDPGCMSVVPLAAGDVSNQPGALHVASRVGDPAGILDLDIVVVDGVDLSITDIDDAIAAASDLFLDANALTLGEVDLYHTDAVSHLINTEGADINTLRAESVNDRLAIFFVSDFLDQPGTLGYAGGIPGPNGVGATASSGVVIAVDSHRLIEGDIDTWRMGETIAHEIGHQFGLFHTTENNGFDHDVIADTPECDQSNDLDGDGMLTPTECHGRGGSHVMFWTAGTAQSIISEIQSDVLFFNPLVR